MSVYRFAEDQCSVSSDTESAMIITRRTAEPSVPELLRTHTHTAKHSLVQTARRRIFVDSITAEMLPSLHHTDTVSLLKSDGLRDPHFNEGHTIPLQSTKQR